MRAKEVPILGRMGGSGVAVVISWQVWAVRQADGGEIGGPVSGICCFLGLRCGWVGRVMSALESRWSVGIESIPSIVQSVPFEGFLRR